jgi:hypothetical protein
VLPKVCSADLKGTATSSQGIRGYISLMATLKFTNFLIKQLFFNNRGTSLIGDVLISYDPYYYYCYYFLGLCSPARATASSFTRFLDHTHSDAPQAVGLLWTSNQPVAETSTWQHTTHTTNIHAPGRIRTHDRSRRAAVDLRLRPRGAATGTGVWPLECLINKYSYLRSEGQWY